MTLLCFPQKSDKSRTSKLHVWQKSDCPHKPCLHVPDLKYKGRSRVRSEEHCIFASILYGKPQATIVTFIFKSRSFIEGRTTMTAHRTMSILTVTIWSL